MQASVTGVGCWLRGVHSWQQWQTAAADSFTAAQAAEWEAPKPAAIPARERRRAGLTINLAVEVVHQACEQAGLDKHLPASFFVSAMGDTDITDYMCRKLAQPEKLLSPTKFHNSVHNAASGYWTISAENRTPSGYVGGYQNSFAVGLLETLCWSVAEQRPAALAAYDIRNAAPFQDICPVDEHLGLALIVSPADDGVALRAEVQTEARGALQPHHAHLQHLAMVNPAGRGLSLLEALLTPRGQWLSFAVGSGTFLNVQVGTR